MNLQQLYYFQAIYQWKNYTKASEQLNITQSSLSHSISDLEKELEVPLFYKQGRNIVPSEYADRFYLHVNRITEELAEARQEIRDQLDPQTGTVRIGMSHTLSNDFMPGMIRCFCSQPGCENVRFEWSEMVAAEVNQALCERKIDLGFGARIEDSALVFSFISADKMILIVPRDHPLSGRETAALQEIDGEPLITFTRVCGTRYDIDRLLRDNGVHPSSIQEAATEKLIAGLVAAGRGVAIVPVVPDLSMYDVIQIRLEGEAVERPMYMEWLRDDFMRPVVRSFRDFVVRKVSKA
ncbi:MAG: LysR family transcriptional regulator [Lachnospiraceae bacterium]|nr:LysR family transcriptional regulator [Lachnospiraceae bacterium]